MDRKSSEEVEDLFIVVELQKRLNYQPPNIRDTKVRDMTGK